MDEPVTAEEFDAMVAAAIDALPEQFREALDKVPVVVSDLGASRGAYGEYQGDGIAREYFPDRIFIYRDTLIRDFGDDRDILADQVERVVRHELGHHFGFDEHGVRQLGL